MVKTTKKKKTVEKDLSKKTKKKVKESNKKVLQFDDSDVDALEPLEAIRVRYDMYIGSADPSGQLVDEAIDNSVDEFMNGFGDKINIDIDTKENKITVEDYGRGLPLGMNTKKNQPTIQVLFTHVHSGAKYNKNVVKTSGGKNGVGIKCITALAKYLEVTSIRKDDGVTFKKGNMEFSRGKITKEFKRTTIKKPSKNTHVGTTISFIPDETIFGEEKAKFNIEKIKKKLELKTYLNAGLTINLTIDGVKTKFYHKNGIVDYIRTMVKEPLYNMDTIYFSGKDEDENSYEISMILNNDLDEHIVGFVNSLSLENGGTHETGFKKGMTRVFLDYIKNNNMLSGKDKNLNIKGEDIRRGLICVISIKHDNPLYDGQTKDKLTNTDIDPKVAKIVTDNLSEWLEKNTKLAKAICNRIIAFARATSSTKEKMKKIVSVSQNSSGLELTEKFMDCETDDSDECEIIIMEGIIKNALLLSLNFFNCWNFIYKESASLY